MEGCPPDRAKRGPLRAITGGRALRVSCLARQRKVLGATMSSDAHGRLNIFGARWRRFLVAPVQNPAQGDTGVVIADALLGWQLLEDVSRPHALLVLGHVSVAAGKRASNTFNKADRRRARVRSRRRSCRLFGAVRGDTSRSTVSGARRMLRGTIKSRDQFISFQKMCGP